MIDHTLLKQDASSSEIKSLCQEALEHQFYAVCVNPTRVQLANDILKNSEVKVCTVIGFPLGATTSTVKAFEARESIDHGADEIDMVMNIGAFKDEKYACVEDDIRKVVHAASNQALVKVIIETSLLTNSEKKLACELAVQAGAQYVKTSTGFSTHGATVDDIRLMRKTVGSKIGVKASGGIRDREMVEKLIAAGATRIGTSAGVSLMKK